MPAVLLALFLATTGPPEPQTTWMRLEAFHLSIGMTRAQALDSLRAWNPKPGKDGDELVVDYANDKAMTLEFRNQRLRSVRFELFALLPHIQKAFDEEKAYLSKALGAPRRSTSTILIYDNLLPNLIVVAREDPQSEQGKKGLGVLAVRYYDPR